MKTDLILATLPWAARQDSTNSIEFVDVTGEATGLQLFNPDGDITEADLAIAIFVVAAVNSQRP